MSARGQPGSGAECREDQGKEKRAGVMGRDCRSWPYADAEAVRRLAPTGVLGPRPLHHAELPTAGAFQGPLAALAEGTQALGLLRHAGHRAPVLEPLPFLEHQAAAAFELPRARHGRRPAERDVVRLVAEGAV